MFKKTRIRLVVLNSIVFFMILNCFGASLYFYMQHRLYNPVDGNLREEANHIQLELMKPEPHATREREREVDRRIVYLMWDKQGQIVRQVPDNAFFTQDLQKLRPSLKDTPFTTVRLDDRAYRVFNLQASGDDDKGLISGPPVQTIQLIYNLEREQEMLRSLLYVIIIGGVVSALVAFVAGWFLANKALVPIQNAWNKQQQFVEDASHELRTPLAVMKLHLERLFRHPEHTVEQESEHISEVIHETRRMSKLVADLLTLARSDSPQLEIMKQPLQMDEILSKVVEQFRELAIMKEIQIESSIDTPIEMIGDRERLHQLFVILLDNALKYTRENGQILVTCKRVGSGANITVKDTGVGIPKEDLPLIFDRFYRGDKARNRAMEGTGLGLSIAKWIIDIHGGKVRVESETGAGTSFLIYFPAKAK